MKTIISILVFFLITITSWSQQQISLETCYQLVSENYPLVKQRALFENKTQLELDAIDTAKLPQLGFDRSEEHTSELQSRPHLVCRLLLEKKKKKKRRKKKQKKKKKKKKDAKKQKK